MPIDGPELAKKETCGSQQSGRPQRLRSGEERNRAAHEVATRSGLLANDDTKLRPPRMGEKRVAIPRVGLSAVIADRT